MSSYPEKLRLAHDNRKLKHVGILPDGRLILQTNQFDPADPKSRQFFVTYVFEANGELADDIVTLIGEADDNSDGTALGAVTGHIKKFGPYKSTDIDVKPFSISRHGLTFGLVARQLDGDGEEEDDTEDAPWIVEALPGITMVFHAPFNSGSYDG